jgi:hypothetical protein
MNKKPISSKPKKKINWKELIQTYKFLLLIPLLLLFLFYRPSQGSFLANLLDKLKFLFLTLIWAVLGILVGGLLLVLFKNKGQLIIDNTREFLEFCKNSHGIVFFGPIDSGKTAILAMLAHALPTENKYASFPCQLPWVKRYQIDFSVAPDRPLGVQEDIFIDETNLLFKGNLVQEVREKQRFLMHFMALSRQQGVRVFANGQRLGQFSIEQREITTAVCQVQMLQKIDEGIYVQCEIWSAAAWTNSKTEQGFIIFIPKKYLDTYNSYWLKSLKYLRPRQSYI